MVANVLEDYFFQYYPVIRVSGCDYCLVIMYTLSIKEQNVVYQILTSRGILVPEKEVFCLSPCRTETRGLALFLSFLNKLE
jgi:hypothetical protein